MSAKPHPDGVPRILHGGFALCAGNVTGRTWLILLLPAALAMAAFAGCQVRKYDVEMTPHEDKLERKLTAYRQRSNGDQVEELPVEDRELARIAAQYGAAIPQGGGPKHTFSKAFAGRLPDDVGGYGTYTRWPTSLGTATVYVERVRGDDDIAANLDQRRAAVQRLVALLDGWLEKEFADTPELPKLRSLLDGALRRDLVNLSIYMKSLELVGAREQLGPSTGHDDAARTLMEHLLRIGQYFVERGYLAPDQLPDWIYAVDQAMQDRPGRLLTMLQRWLASRLGVPADQPVPASLARLADGARVLASLRGHLQASDEYRALTKKREQPSEPPGEHQPPDPWQVLGELAWKAFLPGGALLGGDRLTATLALPCAPLSTNGRWKAGEQRVEWVATLVPKDKPEEASLPQPLPDVLFAIWVEPAAQVQTERFGKVVLDGTQLVEYCLWRRGLPEEKARLWESFLGGLKPGANLSERIGAFRFPDEPRDGESRSAAREIRDMLASGLK